MQAFFKIIFIIFVFVLHLLLDGAGGEGVLLNFLIYKKFYKNLPIGKLCIDHAPPAPLIFFDENMR